MFSESPCEGVSLEYVVQGSTASDTIQNLYSLFCGCKFIKRSFSINLLENNNQIFEEQDFNIFYHLQEISNSFYLNNVNMNGGRFILPNLKIIRAEDYFFHIRGYSMAMLINNVNASELILPRLTEISFGGVDIHANSWQLINLRRVLWSDIIDLAQFVAWINHQVEKPEGRYYVMPPLKDTTFVIAF